MSITRFAITVAGIFLGTFATVVSVTGAELPSLKIRQMIIRVPEEKFLQSLEARPTDGALAKQLYEWLDSGAAKLVQDHATTATPGNQFQTKEGTVYKWVTENDQDWDGIPKLIPTSWEDVFLGTTLEGDYPADQWDGFEGDHGPTDPFSGTRSKLDDMPGGRNAITLGWRTDTRSRMATKVPWPLVWPENKTPAVGIYEQDDFLAQSLTTFVRVQPGNDAIVGFIRPATDMESKPAQPELDVVVAQVRSSSPASPTPSSSRKASPAPPRVQLFGFGLENTEALALLTTHQSGNDAALLAKLRAMAQENKAIRRLACGAAVSSSRTTLTSAREHHFPTEMPTIPSAWETRPVGIWLQMELINRSLNLSLRLDPARFRWAQWDCALDAPELIMRQPQFYQQQVDVTCEFREGQPVVLVGAMRTPECLKSTEANVGPAMGETVLFFAELYQPEGTPPLKVLTHEQGQEPQKKQADLEALIFDLPASERAEWEGKETEGGPIDDESRFQKALARVKDGSAGLVCHLTTVAGGGRTMVKNIEETTFVTEYNPVDHNPYGRYRPTALEASSVGSFWNVDVTSIEAETEFGSTPVIRLASALHHDALPAVLPTLKESLEYTKTHQYELPTPLFTVDEWQGNLILLPGKARCLGIKQPPALVKKDRIHVAFMRARVRP